MLLNIVQSQVAWFAAVLGAAWGHPWIGTSVALAVIVLYVAFSARPRRDALMAVAAGVVGALADTALAQTGLVTFASGTILVGVTTPWMVVLWMNFATVLNGALRSLQGKTLAIPCVLGMVAGPVAYASGARLGALSFTSTGAALACIAVEWGIALPLLFALANRQNKMTSRSRPALCLIGISSIAALSPQFQSLHAQENNTRRWTFKVDVDGHPIGEHDYVLTEGDGVETVESTVRIEYKIALIPIYRYRHDAHETWKGQCLAKLTAQTDDNGTRQNVSAERQDDGSFQIESSQAPRNVKDCVRSFAYWDLNRLKVDHLLNPQTGRYEDSRLELLGPDTLTVSGEKRPCKHYRLHASVAGPIELWYSDSGEWLRLQSKTPQGKTITYERTS